MGLAITRINEGRKNVSGNSTRPNFGAKDRFGEWWFDATGTFSANAILGEETVQTNNRKQLQEATATGTGRLWCVDAVATTGQNQNPRCVKELLVSVDTSGATSGEVYLDSANTGEIVLTPNGGPQVGYIVGDDLVLLCPQRYDRTVLYDTETIANAAVRTLNATPVTVIAAPGAGKSIQLVGCDVMLDYATAAFDAVGANDFLQLQFASGDVLTLNKSPIGFGDATADAWMRLEPNSVIYSANAAVQATIGTGEWYAAAGGGDLVFTIAYRVVTLTDL